MGLYRDQGEIFVECRSCKHHRGCSSLSERHRKSLFAWANDRPVDDCRDYRERSSRGVAGVLDLPAPLLIPGVSQRKS